MRKTKDRLALGAIWISVIITLSTLVVILGYIFSNGYEKINYKFLTSNTTPESVYTHFKKGETYDFTYEIVNKNDKFDVIVTEIRTVGTLKDNNDKVIDFLPGTHITSVDNKTLEELGNLEIDNIIKGLKAPTSDTKVKITVPGGGIFPLILTTLYAIVIAIVIAVPIGLCAAIYLIEYKVGPKLNACIHFAIDSLSAIPSIIFGLFGFIFFSISLKLGISLIAAILTITIMLLPIIIKTIEESLLAVPDTLRESSYGLGATKTQTIFKVVLPCALPGILVAIILAIGRIIGESAIFIFAAGTTAQMPKLFEQASTLTVYAYSVTREFNDIQTASAIGIVIIVIVLILNLSAKYLSNKLNKGSKL